MLCWSFEIYQVARRLGVTLEDVSAIISSCESVKHLRVHLYEYSKDGIRVLLDTTGGDKRIVQIDYLHHPPEREIEGWALTNSAYVALTELGTTMSEIQRTLEEGEPLAAREYRTVYRGEKLDVVVNESNRVIVTIKPCGEATTIKNSVAHFSGGSPIGSMPQDVKELIARAEKVDMKVELAKAGHYKIWKKVRGKGKSVTIPSTGSDNYRGLRNSIGEIKRVLGKDLRNY
ncbi:hypothetical protein [Rothia dentocariosa]|uniref:hypothetical protein n=1 Tax=Rothia dentocariosa TaxID=2047 RepID=UPI003A8815B3